MDILDIDEALKDDSYMWVMHSCCFCVVVAADVAGTAETAML